MLPDSARRAALRQLQHTSEALAWLAGYIGLPWAKLKHKVKVDETVDTYAISADGVLTINPTWFASQRPDERVYVLAASIMRFLLQHHARGVDLGIVDPKTAGAPEGKEHEHGLWGEACASVINYPLREDGIGRPPADAVFPPADYKGSPDAESLYYYLVKVRPKPPPPPPPNEGGGQDNSDSEDESPPSPHAGGHPQPPQDQNEKKDGQDQKENQGQDGGDQASEAPLTPDDIEGLRRAVEHLAQLAGKGSHVVDALKPKVARTDYRRVIGAGLDFANTESADRTTKTYARASRREALLEGLILPGYVGSDPSVCIVIDKSGSTSAYAQKFIDHAYKVARDYPQVRMYLIVHTSIVTWEDWIKPGGDVKKLEEASRASGGTAFQPAYAAARVVAPRGKFDSLVHFTDGFNNEDWPLPPARRLVVGLCGSVSEAATTPLPCPAKVIPISMED